ncbi:uncharacterized protein N7496_007449 [Penicillium cataractarum]|uniref:Uncharacterized protein n=1 Tax=Penicillium cataractarum TaxID=2100454 RepID=A0A9W9S480_9EURO|nr:uncharacterized protein N7496_007449 [Penicillium cataractarum]KAJ5371357.1 hypothetical protein N7496_007449 [Penicillium cataractarum]
MSRSGFFWSGKRQEERISERLANVESAVIQCLGEVQVDECDCCKKSYGPWAKCIRMSDGEGDLLACGNCRWNGNYKRCTFWQAEQDEKTLAGGASGHRRAKPSISKDMTKNAFNEIEKLRNAVVDIAGQIKQLCQGQQQGLDENRTEQVATLTDQIQDVMNSTKPAHETLRKVCIPCLPGSSNR